MLTDRFLNGDDDDLIDISEEKQEMSDIDKITQLWIKERSSPDILVFDSDLVSRLNALLISQVIPNIP